MNSVPSAQRDLSIIKWLTFFMFMMFAMTTDSVGVIIPEVIKEFHLRISPQHDSGRSLPLRCYVRDRICRFLPRLPCRQDRKKKSIILGLVLFALNSYMFSVGR